MGAHLLNEAQGDRFYRFTGISGNTRFSVNDRHTNFLIKIDIGDGFNGVNRRNAICAAALRRQRHFAHITDIRRHLRQHWQRGTPFHCPTIFFYQLRALPDIATHRMRSHLRTGEVTLDHIRASFLHQARQLLPLLLIFPHDRSDQYFVRVIFLQPTQGGQILFQRMFSNLLHIFEADKTGIFFHQMIKTRRDFVGDKKADRFKHHAAPTCVVGFGTHLIAVAYRRRREAERVGKLHAAKSNRKIFR